MLQASQETTARKSVRTQRHKAALRRRAARQKPPALPTLPAHPKPRERPLMWSCMICASTTSPYWLK